jgi:prevent-host-death family protein
MFTMDSIHPVSDFSRKPAEHIKRLKETGRPEILTVNGKAEVVIQSAKAYEEMVGLIGTLEKIARAAKEHDEGQGILIDTFFREFEKKHGLTRDAVQG